MSFWHGINDDFLEFCALFGEKIFLPTPPPFFIIFPPPPPHLSKNSLNPIFNIRSFIHSTRWWPTFRKTSTFILAFLVLGERGEIEARMHSMHASRFRGYSSYRVHFNYMVITLARHRLPSSSSPPFFNKSPFLVLRRRKHDYRLLKAHGPGPPG